MVKEQHDKIINSSQDGKINVSQMTRDSKVWLNQFPNFGPFWNLRTKHMLPNANILKDNELDSSSVIKNYLTTASDGKNYNVICNSLEMIRQKDSYRMGRYGKEVVLLYC